MEADSDRPEPDRLDPQLATRRLQESLQAQAEAWGDPPDAAGGDERIGSPRDGAAFVSWMLSSARLAAVGEEGLLRSWPRLASLLGIDVQQSIERAAAEGIRRIESSDGRALAEEIGRAEDASCLAIMESRTTQLLSSTLAGRWLAAWTEAASNLPLDEDGLSFLDERRRCWPLPQDMRLPVVDTPLGEMDLLLGSMGQEPPRRLVPRFTHVEEAALFDDGRPTPGMIQRFATRRGAGSLSGGRWIRAEAELDPYWQVTLGIQAPGVGVRSVRIGPMTMGLHPDAPDPYAIGTSAETSDGGDPATIIWSVSLMDLPLAVQTRVISGDISIRTDEGDRFLL